MTKIKAVTEESEAQGEGCSQQHRYQELLVYLNPIAQHPGFPPPDLRKIEKGKKKKKRRPTKQKQIRHGVKEVQKFVNKGKKGIMVLTGDTLRGTAIFQLCARTRICPTSIFPLTDLGAAMGSKHPTCVIMVKLHEEYHEAYDKCLEEVQTLATPL
uniref:Ribosomal protein eL8/eL30/eS12/Gadd45 domain-containing protein n=1 Tax=Rattus norvegicus TaxID=10116 RepID=A0A8I5ZZY5_RAT